MEKITDVFGNIVVNRNVPILLISTKINSDLLINIIDDENESLWEPDQNKINELLKKNNIIPDVYKTFGHYWYPHIRCNIDVTIILANIKYNFISQPIDFINIGSFKDGYIWKPICNKNHVELGLLYDKIKPQLDKICTILYLYTIEYNGKYDVIDNYTNFNEFNLLGSNNIPRKTIYRAHFIKKNKILKIKNLFNNNYLNINGNDNIIFTKKPANVIYTTNGQIKINNKCLERIYSNENNLSISLRECNDTNAQKWFPFGIPNIHPNPEYHLISQNDMLHMTLLSDGDDDLKKNIIATEKLIGNKKQIFKFENIVNDRIIFNKNNSQIMLVESNNPWYINKSNNISQKHYNNNLYENDNFQDLNNYDNDPTLLPGSNNNNNFSSNASYYPNKTTDNAMRNSYNNFTLCSRCKDNKKEHFTNDNSMENIKINNNRIIIILLIIILIIFLILKKQLI